MGHRRSDHPLPQAPPHGKMKSTRLSHRSTVSALLKGARRRLGNASPMKLVRWPRARGPEFRNRPLGEDEVAVATRLYRSGLSLVAVCERLARDQCSVRFTLFKARIPRRDTHGRPGRVAGRKMGPEETGDGTSRMFSGDAMIAVVEVSQAAPGRDRRHPVRTGRCCVGLEVESAGRSRLHL